MDTESPKPKPKRWPKILTVIGRVIVLLWILAGIYAGYLLSPFIGSMYSITKIPGSYFEIKIDKESFNAVRLF